MRHHDDIGRVAERVGTFHYGSTRHAGRMFQEVDQRGDIPGAQLVLRNDNVRAAWS